MAVLVCAAAVFALTRPGDVFNPDVEFRAEPTETAVPEAEATPTPKKKAKKKDPLAGFQWAQYGYSRDRRRYLPTRPSIAPPWKIRWNWDANVLLEFPPIIVGDRLFLIRNDGQVVALNRLTGKAVWRRDMGYLAASSPAYAREEDRRDDPRAHQGRRRARRRAVGQDRQGRVVASRCRAARSRRR